MNTFLDKWSIILCDYLLPMTTDAICCAGIVLSDECVIDFGPSDVIQKKYPSLPVKDYSGYIILPGFVNAHAHLELSCLKGCITPKGSFSEWLRALIPLKRELSDDVIVETARKAMRDLERSGVVAVGDVSSEYLSWKLLAESSLYCCVFLEFLPVRDSDIDLVLGRLKETLTHICSLSSYLNVGISPHATYTLSPKALNAIIPFIQGQNLPLTIHVSESIEEWEMFVHGRGKLLDFMREFRDWANLGYTSPLEYLYCNNALLHQSIIVHLNILDDGDYDLLKKSRAVVVHCPLSHRYFQHPPFPLMKLLECGISVALGTDSLASNRTLDFFEELRELRRVFPKIPASLLVSMATINGAKALRLPRGIGEITQFTPFSLLALKIDSRSDPFESVIGFSGKPVHLSQYNF